MLIAFNKPYGVICQFSPDNQHHTLKDYINIPRIYPAGRLDTDSEGLLLLTDDGRLQNKITQPNHHLTKTYWAQVEGIPTDKDKSNKDNLPIPTRIKRRQGKPALAHMRRT